MNGILLALQALPAVLQLILSVESLLPSNTPGADKKSAVMAGITSVLDVAPAAIPHVSAAIDSLVGVLNATGAWPKGQAALNKASAGLQAAAPTLKDLGQKFGLNQGAGG